MEPETSSGGRLAGKVAFITGAAQGIGRAIMVAFAREGAAVVGADINTRGVTEVASAIEADGARALAVTCDVTDTESVKRGIEAAVQGFGHLDVLVANAATFSPVTSIDLMDESDWQKALDVNLTGAFHVCKHGIPHLKSRHREGGGSIILMASQMGRVANAGQAAYCASKGALIQLAKGMALDHAGDAIRVNALSPGGIATDRMVARFGTREAAEEVWGAKHPMGRLGRPEEIAAGAVFLASDESSFMTGADLLCDGGYTAW